MNVTLHVESSWANVYANKRINTNKINLPNAILCLMFCIEGKLQEMMGAVNGPLVELECGPR